MDKATKESLAPNWAEIPNWVAWVAIDGSGAVFGFEGEPYPQRITPVWNLKKSEKDGGLRMITELGVKKIPRGVRWQELCWKRPDDVTVRENAANR